MRIFILLGGEENAQLFEQMFGEKEAMLFGEGYGKGIQAAGKAYNPEGVDFILFDLFIVGNYQPRESVEHCAAAFGLTTVPVVGKGTLDEAEGGRIWTSAVGTARILTKNICSAGNTDSMRQRSEWKRAKHRSEILPIIGFRLISAWICAKMGLGEAK